MWIPQTVTIINISDQTYDHLQRHPQRGAVALASWLGDEEHVAVSLQQLEQSGVSDRKTPEEWETLVATLRANNVDEATIDGLRTLQGPVTTGVPAIVSSVPAPVVDAAADRLMVERAGLFDRKIIADRRSFDELRTSTTGPERTAADHAARIMTALGISDISVTQQFPIVIASYGYTRIEREPGRAHLRSYAKPKRYNGKTPVFAVPARTEALLLTFDAAAILRFLEIEGALPAGQPTENACCEARRGGDPRCRSRGGDRGSCRADPSTGPLRVARIAPRARRRAKRVRRVQPRRVGGSRRANDGHLRRVLHRFHSGRIRDGASAARGALAGRDC
ncbi:MAG: hypothetical protein V9E94_19420 [Microthrixaceae bacterium]